MNRIPENVEKSEFRQGAYIGWDGRGEPYIIKKHGSQWRADPAPNHRSRLTTPTLRGKTLTEVAKGLAEKKPVAPLEPF